jgi:small-conductance mechanosensitive channel
MESWMKFRQWLIPIGLLVLVLAAVIASILTRNLGAPETSSSSESVTDQTQLVDERPLQTARAMAKLASNSDEQRVAAMAVQFADNEVDLAFHDALRDAADHPPQNKPQNRGFYEHASQAEAQVKADQTAVDELKKQLASAAGARQGNLQEQLDVAQAQLELDQDELNDAREDLVRSGADPGSLIQRQFDQHQAAEHTADEKPAQAAENKSEVNYQAGNLMAQFAAWRALRNKAAPLQQARDEAIQDAAALTRAHDALEKQIAAEKLSKPPINRPAIIQSNSTLQAQGNARTAIQSLHLLSGDQKNLADLDRRIRDQQQSGNSYATWIAMVQSHQRVAVHGMTQSLIWILLIVMSVYLTDRVIYYQLGKIGPERTRWQTLRAVIRFAVQAVGVLLILLVILGTPSQMPTILGLAGAGLTVALKDFIVAFFGWFVLMGKNGLRVGDWVEINGVAGEVVEINLLRTVLLETGNWTDTGHPTGRKVAFVNTYAIEGHFFNFTTSGQWMWDELKIMLPSNADPYPLLDAMQKAVAKETEANVQAAGKEWQSSASRYKVSSVSAAQPAVNLWPTALGAEVHVRYITRAEERSAMRARLNQALVQLLHQQGVDERSGVPAAR